MIKVYNIKKEDPELEAIRQLKPDHTPDVVDSVMKRIATMPQPMALPQHKRSTMRIISGLAAACLAGIVIVTFVISHIQGVQAANVNSDIYHRVLDIYQYNNDYANDEAIEDAAYYDNPITDFI